MGQVLSDVTLKFYLPAEHYSISLNNANYSEYKNNIKTSLYKRKRKKYVF